MIAWCNENSGFLMVIITAVYVIATIFICVFNGKSAKIAHEQQKQNAGLQLYSLRSDVVHKLFKDKSKDVVIDVGALFGREFEHDWLEIVVFSGKIEETEKQIELFENAFYGCLSEEDAAAAKLRIEGYRLDNCIDRVSEIITEEMNKITDQKRVDSNMINDYINNLKSAYDFTNVLAEKRIALVNKLLEFLRESIQ